MSVAVAIAALLSLAPSGLLWLLARILARSVHPSDVRYGVLLSLLALLWTVGPLLLSLWLMNQAHTGYLSAMLLLWSVVSVSLVALVARGIEAAARP